MSRPELFPKTRPLDDPPEPRDTLRHGHRTPCYALAWVCPPQKYKDLIPGGTTQNVASKIKTRWFEKNKFPRTQRPEAYFGADGNFYLIAMLSNRDFPGFATRAQNPEDELIVAAKEAMFVSSELEHTLAWYRYPMSRPYYTLELEESTP